MRTKLFFAFLAVVAIALISNLIYKNFIVKDFEDYVSGSKEDKLYWVLAAVEGGYSDGRWVSRDLHETVHWAMMLGFDLKISDTQGNEIINSGSVMESLTPSMKRRMEGIIDIASAKGEYETYPLYEEGSEIGTMSVRELKRMGTIAEKEKIFKERGREFLLISFLIAGGGALLLSVFFTLFLSMPLNRMKRAVESMAEGDFSVRVDAGSKKDEIGKLSESFNFMAEALQREEALRKRLTSNIAHELRTPLAVMKANIEAMIDGIVENNSEGLENIRMEIEKLIRLVEGIEDITKAEASFFHKKEYEEINLSQFLSGIVNKMMPLAAGKGLVLKLLSDTAVNVLTDPEKLETILRNILTNAIKNTEKGRIRIDYSTEKNMFFIEIVDTGIGIPEDKIDLVFKRFYRSDDSKGIGLGLAIVKELVEVMGGRIDLKSKLGEGSTFTVWLPMKGEHEDTV
ncbi:MAG: HAMP domain-containing sensor histidine kinase [Nitrospirota bacterium]